MAEAPSTAPRIYLVAQNVRKKWRELVNGHRSKLRKSGVHVGNKNVCFQYDIGFVLNKVNCTRETWYDAVAKYKDKKGGPLGFMTLCQKCKLHEGVSNAVKLSIVQEVLHQCRITKTTTHTRTDTTLTQRPLLLTQHRSYMKQQLIPYITGLYKCGVLDSNEFSPELLLSDEVLNYMTQNCYDNHTLMASKKNSRYQYIKN